MNTPARPRQLALRLASCVPFLAAVLLLPVAGAALAADDEAVLDAPLERISDAPWKLSKRKAPLQRRLQLELQPDHLTPRPALDFQNAPKSSGMPVGMLRMSLNDHSSVSWRPRKGGMHLTYRESF